MSNTTTRPNDPLPGTAGSHGNAEITIEGSRVDIARLTVHDPVLADLLAAQPADRRADELARVIEVGARGITTMGAGMTVTDVAEQVTRALSDTTEAAQRRVDAVLEAGGKALSETLDPDARASIAARMVERLAGLHRELLTELDPGRAASHTGRFLGELGRYFAPAGELDVRLAGALDSTADGSPMAALRAALEGEIRALRDAVMREAGRSDESEKGTRKGVDYEDTIEELLRQAARGFGGVVERTSHAGGSLGPDARVGDFVVTLPDGARVVVEAKNTSRLGLTGTGGILEELDRGMANRGAGFAVCVSAQPAFPAEVGALGVYGNRVLVVDEGDGPMLDVAVRWARAALAGGRDASSDLDTALVAERLDRIRDMANRFSSSKRALASIRSSVDTVRNDLDEMRTGLIELVEEARLELRRATLDAAPTRIVA